MTTKKVFIYIVIGVLLFGAGFWAGTAYQKNKTSTKSTAEMPNGTPPSMNGGSGTSAKSGNMGTPPSGGNGGPGGNGTSGEIVSKSDTSLTLKTSDGSTKTIYFNDSTKISKNANGSTSDLTTGTNIQVNGTTNDDKSITGTTIMIMPEAAE